MYNASNGGEFMHLDRCVQDFNAMLQLPEPRERQRQSLENWFLGNKPLVRSESKCFQNITVDKDYVALGNVEKDRAGLESLLDFAVKVFPNISRRV